MEELLLVENLIWVDSGNYRGESLIQEQQDYWVARI